MRKLLGSSGARLLTSMGISVASYAGLTVAMTAALNAVAAGVGGLPSAVANIMLLMGFGQALSIIGAAFMTKAAIQSSSLGFTKTSST
ncbi:hypothetical protein N789_14650 [Arenimonas oryziterrae DSM 21050 = YC6267]|uniref:DUF2523 domain-containing protein n=1 Tax=Arenimonas oryziterrae DSM 21050 = YC6267 TaxID=1121015 RepID=A0A091AT11_9GAMM|nr:hypothetical protein N789_14650 [Arenimonas oryziterrae DSM 21050 = YC6267]